VSGATAHLVPADLPVAVKDRIQTVADLENCDFQIALVESMMAKSQHNALAARSGALVGLISTNEESSIPLWRLLAERALCVNTTAAGGNASLMTLETA
jgi:RHH-type proline utilization regulon transcriptional repressor/proline dehydrogenase/delta 1-pyrroline-5-carboxylate dehydrogenase